VKLPYFYFRSEIRSHHLFIDPDFLYDAGIPAIREQLRQKLASLYLHRFSGLFGPKWRGGQDRGRGGAMLTSNKLVLLGSFYHCATFGENRSRDATVRVRTDRQTDTPSEKTGFMICAMLCAIAMGADNDTK